MRYKLHCVGVSVCVIIILFIHKLQQVMGPGTSCCILFNQMEDHVAPDYSFRALPQLSHVPKFDGSNHREWNYELDLCFQNLEIAGIVLGQELCPIEVKQSRELFYSLSCRTMSHQSTCCSSFTNLFSLFFYVIHYDLLISCMWVTPIHENLNVNQQ